MSVFAVSNFVPISGVAIGDNFFNSKIIEKKSLSNFVPISVDAIDDVFFQFLKNRKKMKSGSSDLFDP